MGRSPCCEKAHTNKGAWTKEEDQRLISYIRANGEGCWRALPKAAGLARCGKSCRLRWINYLRPDLKRGNFTDDEDDTIIKLHAVVGNKWSLIAARLPGRTDNEIKNYWNTHIKRKLLNRGIDPQTHRPVANSDTDDGTRDSKIAGSPRRLPITIHWKTEPPATTTIALDSAPVEPHRDAFFSSQSPLLPVKPEPADGFNVDQTASSSNSSGRSAVEDNDPTTTSVTADDCHHRNNYGDDAGGIDLNLSISLPSYTSFSNHHQHHSSPTNSQASFTASPICRSPSTIAATSTSQSQTQQLQHYTYYAAAAPHHAPPAHPCTCPLIPLPSPTTTTAASIHLPPPPGVVNPYAMFGFFVPLQGSPGFGQRALHQE